MHEKPPQNNENNLDTKRFERMLELVKTNPDFQYMVSINGNLKGQGEMNGQKEFHFDQKSQTIVSSDSDYGYSSLDNPKNIPRKQGGSVFEIVDDKEFRHYVWRLGFNAISKNNFTTEHRGGTHISTALRVLKDKKIFDELGEEKLKEFLTKDTPESRKFLGEFLSKCNQEFIPDYWNFVLEQIKK